MILWKPPRIAKKLVPGLIWDLSANSRTVYLTFDDGPTADITGNVLEILGRYGAKATFFCIGRNVERNPEIFRAIRDAGHEVGNHTYSHIKGWYTPDKDYFEDIELASRFVKSGLFRPAYGMIRPSQARYLQKHYKIIMWNLLSYDFHIHITKEKCLDYVVKNTRPGSVVVFHDSVKASENLFYTLPRILEYFTDKGCAFNTVSTGLKSAFT